MGKKVLRIDYRKPVIVAVTDQGEATRLITRQRYSLNFSPLELESRLCHAGRMKKPHLEITQNDKSGLHGKCSSCDEYFTIGGPGLARNPAASMKTLHRQFDKHCKQVHPREDASQASAGIVRGAA